MNALWWRRAATVVATLGLAGVAVPAQAGSDLDGVGGGEVLANVALNPPIQPLLAARCGPVQFTLTGGSTLVVMSLSSVDSTGTTGYIGPVNFSGSGSSSCEDAADALGGFLTLSVSGTVSTGTLSCASLTGGYFRVATHVVVQAGGTCSLNGTAFQTSIDATGDLEPTQGDGITTAVSQGTFIGTFVITV